MKRRSLFHPAIKIVPEPCPARESLSNGLSSKQQPGQRIRCRNRRAASAAPAYISRGLADQRPPPLMERMLRSGLGAAGDRVRKKARADFVKQGLGAFMRKRTRDDDLHRLRQRHVQRAEHARESPRGALHPWTEAGERPFG